MAVTIQTRRDNAADWTTANPVLALGEIGIETDTDKAKYGDGFTAWNDLEYWIDQHPVGEPVPPGTNGQTLRWGASWEATSDLVVDDAGNVKIGNQSTENRSRLFVTGSTPFNSGANAIDTVITQMVGGGGTAGNGNWGGTLGFGNTSQADIATKMIAFQQVGSGGNVGDLVFLSNGDAAAASPYTEHMRIDSSGNVGINNTNPNTKLDVRSGNAEPVNIATFGAENGTVGLHFGYNRIEQVGATNWLSFWTNADERMRIDSAGGVLVGLTGGGQGAGTINVSGGYYVNGTPQAVIAQTELDDLKATVASLKAAAITAGWAI